ncbi:hypothetical protein DH2020_006371 [Rehmannia glutinosa]|uniref:RING-type domain-containing protein n=1 Tax=Rehmannia glutinosa TaxID=99300 RepID=A0ABR0XIR1_REHGL
MGIFYLLPFFWLCITPLSTKINGENGDIGDIANTTKNPPPPPPPPAAGSRTTQFKPGIAVTVGIFTTIFSITFLLLLYVNHCKTRSYSDTSRNYPPLRKNSGIDRKVIKSLPIFRFSSLRGQKDGLECAVCLNRFDADEVLRLLPKCKHAFHIECVDIWLEAHSTCPLCRYRVNPEDGKGKEFTNPRISGRHSSAGEGGSSLEIIVENPGEHIRGRISSDRWNSRRKTGSVNRKRDFRCKSLDSWKPSSRRKNGAENPERRSSRKDGQLPVVQVDKHRLEHRIIISGGAEGPRRWSDVEATNLLYLRSEMLIGERESGISVINERSLSEITGMSRYKGSNNGGKEERERQEEGVVERWLAWISQSQQSTAVNSATSSSTSSSILV